MAWLISYNWLDITCYTYKQWTRHTTLTDNTTVVYLLVGTLNHLSPDNQIIFTTFFIFQTIKVKIFLTDKNTILYLNVHDLELVICLHYDPDSNSVCVLSCATPEAADDWQGGGVGEGGNNVLFYLYYCLNICIGNDNKSNWITNKHGSLLLLWPPPHILQGIVAFWRLLW